MKRERVCVCVCPEFQDPTKGTAAATLLGKESRRERRRISLFFLVLSFPRTTGIAHDALGEVKNKR